MYIKELDIEKFRLFDNTKIKLGNFITAITGFNATGKSTLLGLLGHCGELKTKKYKPLLQTSFKVELSEILKFSEQHEPKGISNIGKITFEDYITPSNKYPKELSYRSTWQKYPKKKEKRYRILPRKTSDWPSSSKIDWPTLYLGLSRLYPIGESVDVSRSKPSGTLTDEENEDIINNMKSILNINDESNDFTVASISETNKKKGVGFNTEKYNYLANSAGQDNLGQILMSVLSFRRLKQQMGSEWQGGLLLVDELDATLHPLAQNKLLDFLFHQAREIGIQIVFTTHSLGLLEFLCVKTDHNSTDSINNFELISISNANGPIQVIQNPSYDLIYKELMATYNAPYMRRINVFSEDEQSRYFINKLLESYSYRYNLLDVSLGCDELLRLLISDPSNFSQYIYVLDGDVEQTDIDKYSDKVSPANIRRYVVKLPGSARPEKVIYDYLFQLDVNHPFLLTIGRQMGYSRRSIEENGPLSSKYNGYAQERDKYKHWFEDNKHLIDDVFPYWIEDNKDIIDEFKTEFITAFNWAAQRCCLPIIRPLTELLEVPVCQRPHLL